MKLPNLSFTPAVNKSLKFSPVGLPFVGLQ